MSWFAVISTTPGESVDWWTLHPDPGPVSTSVPHWGQVTMRWPSSDHRTVTLTAPPLSSKPLSW